MTPVSPAQPGADDARERLVGVHGDADQTASDLDQTLSDSDQTLSDEDQRQADAEQARADVEQRASDRDQAAADSDRSRSLDPTTAAARAREVSRNEREAATRLRDTAAKLRSETAAHRLTTGKGRDEVARARDITAEARDRAAQALDEAADARDAAAEARALRAIQSGQGEEQNAALTALRETYREARREAARARAAAAADREAASADRRHAAADRQLARMDGLTGVLRRRTAELNAEIDRARRSDRPLVLTLIDVDGLKAVNDSQGHPAGDTILRDVAAAISGTLRSYDVVVRWGGDEFICALADAGASTAVDRIADIRAALAALPSTASISAGIAELEDGDTLDTLIARADADLYESRAARRG